MDMFGLYRVYVRSVNVVATCDAVWECIGVCTVLDYHSTPTVGQSQWSSMGWGLTQELTSKVVNL